MVADTCGKAKIHLFLLISWIGSYGSMARFRMQSRLKPVGNNCVVGAGGDIADFHALSHLLDSVMYDLVPECNFTRQDGECRL